MTILIVQIGRIEYAVQVLDIVVVLAMYLGGTF